MGSAFPKIFSGFLSLCSVPLRSGRGIPEHLLSLPISELCGGFASAFRNPSSFVDKCAGALTLQFLLDPSKREVLEGLSKLDPDRL